MTLSIEYTPGYVAPPPRPRERVPANIFVISLAACELIFRDRPAVPMNPNSREDLRTKQGKMAQRYFEALRELSKISLAANVPMSKLLDFEIRDRIK